MYGLGPALEVPWYLTGGYMDWLGNITAERDLSVASTAAGSLTWHYPRAWPAAARRGGACARGRARGRRRN